MGKVSLRLDEANDLNFEFKIQGTSSEPGAGNVQFRFIVSEKGNPKGVSYIFPVTTKEDDGTITVSIPATKNMFTEGTAYTGKVEVIIGTRLLVPSTMELEFVKPLSVEVQRIEPVEEKIELDRVVAMVEGPVVPEVNVSGRTVTLTKSQLKAMIQERTAKTKERAVELKLKDSLKDIMKSALED